MDPSRILVMIVEDEAAHAEAIRRAFGAAGTDAEIQVTGTLREYRESVAARAPDIVLADLNLPDGCAVEVLTSPPEAGPFPILIMTGYGTEQLAVEAMRSGALDYIVKSSEAFADLPRTVARALREWNVLQERKRTEEALHATGERLKCLLASTSVAIYAARTSGHYGPTSITENVKEIVGYTARELTEDSSFWLDHVHPEDRQRILTELPRLERGVCTYDYRFQHKDGTYRWMRDEMRLITDAQGNPVGIVGYWIDITERKRAEEALQESEEKYRRLFSHALDPILILDMESHRFLDANEAATRLYGYAHEELLGMRPEELSAEPEQTTAAIHELEQTGSIRVPLRWHRKKDGTVFPVDVSAWPFAWKNRRVSCVFMHDITERKQAEEALEQAATRFRLVTLATQDGIFDWDLVTGAVWRNETYQRLFGMPERSLQGERCWLDRVHPDDRARVMAAEEAVLAGEDNVFAKEYRLRRFDGSYAHVVQRSHIVRDSKDQPVRMIGAIADLTERKQLEEQFRQAQKMEAVGRLAGGVAHDFNNILMAINGYTQLVLRKLSPRHPVRQQVNEIRRAGERAASLTKQLLAFSRRQILVPRILDLNKIVADTKEMLRRVIGEHVELVIRQGHKLAKVLADPGQLAQVLVNLAVNARDAMPGGGRLTIETGNVDLREAETGDLPGAAPGPYVMLAVSDTGVGMSKEVMEHMFEPFFTTREQGKGTGLGLSMVYGVVKQSDGYVRAQSEPGHGSTLRIYLPCARVGSGKPAARSTKARLAKGRGTVLVVEDELAVRQVVAAALRSSGYKVLEAGSGEEAMRRLRRHEGPLHLLLTDLVMPRMNGRQVADSVRTLYPEVKVVFMSGYTDDVLLRQGGSDAQGSFLQKPFTMEVLSQMVREVLKPSP